MAKKPKARVRGVQAVVRAIQKKAAKQQKGMQKGLTKAGLWLLRESMKIVPVDTSALKNTGPVVTRSEGTGFNTVMIVGYGTEYAIFVHEDLSARHKKGKSAKFLETPAKTGRKAMSDIIRTEMKK